MIFRYDQLLDFLVRCRDIAPVLPLRDWTGQRALILRHDVDVDIRPAWDLARVEEEAGIRSSFFFLVTCHFYNAFSAMNRRMIKDLADRGFDIGLHFDPTLYPDADAGALLRHVEVEAAMLADMCGVPVRSVSLHNPTALGGFPLFAGFCNAYDPAIFGPDRYLSDSRRAFRQSPAAFIESWRDAGPRQLLLHPIHFAADETSYAVAAAGYLKRLTAAFDDYFPALNSTWASEIPLGMAAMLRSSSGEWP
jgi:hypothetical protein